MRQRPGRSSWLRPSITPWRSLPPSWRPFAASTGDNAPPPLQHTYYHCNLYTIHQRAWVAASDL